MRTAYIGLDVHASTCTLGYMNSEGRYLEEWTFPTSESQLIRHVVRIKAQKKYLTLEETSLAFWIARTLRAYVDELVVCDPLENYLISRSARKNDSIDSFRLCRLLRLGEVKEVYHPAEDHRAIFKTAVDHYLDLRDQQVALKQKIKAKYRSWGLLDVKGTRLYSSEGRSSYLEQVTHPQIRRQLERLYEVLDVSAGQKKEAKTAMFRLGRRYREICEFQKMPGVGPVIAHVFDGYIQTPERFASKQKLWRYCQLGIKRRESGGKRTGGERLDRAGHGELKAHSYHAWRSAMRTKNDNEVRRFYEQSLARTHNRTHARLNTQRKIVAALWTIWRKNCSYCPDTFIGSANT